MAKAKTRPDRHTPEEVDAYLAELPEDIRAHLDRLRQIIHETAPNATERVSYGIPIFRLKRDLVGMAAHKTHCSFHSMHTGLMTDFAPELKGFKVNNTSIHFTPANPLPRDVIEKIVRFRMRFAE